MNLLEISSKALNNISAPKMKKVYLISGSYTRKGFTKEILRKLKQYIKETYNFCFVSADFDDTKKKKKDVKR